jgi:hypothetical protein
MSIEASGNAMPRVMNVDKNPAYPAAMEALKAEGAVARRAALRQCVRPPARQRARRRADTGDTSARTKRSPPLGEMVGKRGCGRPSSLHRLAVRARRLSDSTIDHFAAA